MMFDLENSLKCKADISNQLNKKFSEFRTKTEKDNAATKKAHRAEIKSWRKELGEEKKEKIKLQEQLEKILSEKKKSGEEDRVEETILPENIKTDEPISMSTMVTNPEYEHKTPSTSISNELSNAESDDDIRLFQEEAVNTSEKSDESIELEEKEAGFIGPRLPRLMSDEEVKALFRRLLGDKYD